MTSSRTHRNGAWIICDYNLPQFSAPAALELIKALAIDVPFFVVSGSIGEERAVEMMRAANPR